MITILMDWDWGVCVLHFVVLFSFNNFLVSVSMPLSIPLDVTISFSLFFSIAHFTVRTDSYTHSNTTAVFLINQKIT